MDLQTRLIVLRAPPSAHLSALENARWWRAENMRQARLLREDGFVRCANESVGHARAWHREIMAMLPAPTTEHSR